VLKLKDSNEQERTVKLIKNEVIDLADRMDHMQVNMQSQLTSIIQMLQELKQERSTSLKA